MSGDIWSLFVHGVGTQRPGFSAKAQRWFAAAREPHKSYGQEACWAPVLDSAEKVMLKDVSRRGSSNRLLQRLVIETLADALCYQNRLEAIFDVLDVAYARLRAPGPVHIAAHSLGVVLTLEWLRARPTVQVGRLTTFGTNLELFNLGAEGKFQCPAQLVGGGRWVNYFDAQDMLGWPIRGWVPQARDVEVSVGGWFTGRTGLAHTQYFTDKGFWRRVAADLG